MSNQTVRCPAPIPASHVDTESLVYRVAGMLQYVDRKTVIANLGYEGYSQETIFLVTNAAIVLNQELEEFLRGT